MLFHSPTSSAGKISLYLVLCFFLALTFFSREIPFFWDEVYYIGTAFHMYDSNFQSIIPPLEYDRGNFPFYGFYMACWWKVFGKTLSVSHIAMLPVLLGITWEYYWLAKKIIPEKWIPFALLLLVLEPTFITQSILMEHDIFLLYFFLLSVRGLLYDKKNLYAFSFCLLAFHNIKGIPIACALVIFYFAYKKYILHAKINSRDFLIHFFPFALCILWMIVHYQVAGWYILTPINDYGNGVHLDASLLKRIVLGIWQITDFGRIFLWLFIAGVFFIYRKKIFSAELKPILLLIFILSALLLLFFAFLDINLCHRYFMPVFLLVNLVACALLAEFVRRNFFQYLIVILLSTGLITGNFWLYGGGFSNGWDSSLKVLPYFKLINEMQDYIKIKKINSSEVGTKFPLYHDIKYSGLSAESFHFTDIDTSSLAEFKYVLFSNVSNQFTIREKETLMKEWELEKELHSGLVYVKLLKRRNFLSEPD